MFLYLGYTCLILISQTVEATLKWTLAMDSNRLETLFEDINRWLGVKWLFLADLFLLVTPRISVSGETACSNRAQ